MEEHEYCYVRCILTKFEELGIRTVEEAIVQLDELHFKQRKKGMK